MAENNKKPIIDETFKKQVTDNPAVLLDTNNNIEQLLPGPSETERNESRLDNLITGEGRPMSHKVKEGAAWTITNVGIPAATGGISKLSTGIKGTRGLELLNKVPNEDLVKGGLAAGEKFYKELAEKIAEEAAEEASKNSLKNSKNIFTWAIKNALNNSPKQIEKKAAMANLDAITTAIKALSSFAPGVPKEMVKRYGTEKGVKIMLGMIAAIRAGKTIAGGFTDTGSMNADDGKTGETRGFDERLEIGVLRKIWQFIKGLIDLDDLDPNKYPMEKINSLINTINTEGGYWNQKQLDDLGGDEKVKLVKDISKGKYEDLGDVSYHLYKTYKGSTNKDED